MSLRANPTAIGSFVIGAVILAVVGVAALASLSWRGERHTFVSFFGESVHGLARGAPVKFQGVPVGTVSDLLVRISQADKTFRAPVEYEIDLERLTTEVGSFLRLNDEAVLREQIANGLRARLQMESLVTGLLYVELTYRPEAELPDLEAKTAYPEIPTTPSLLAAFGTEAGSLVGDVVTILFRVNEILDEVDMQGLNTAVVASAQAIERLVESDELVAAIGELPELSAQLGRTLTGMERTMEQIGGSIDPLQARMEATLDETALTLRTTRQAIEDAQGIFATDSDLGYGLAQALGSLHEAAEALRILAISLERNPDMLLRGHRPPGR
ncbi:MAG: MlaD family protein [Longimicrobiales bacterium]|nr:MlaD family protein [Longimicrobiales bacterium]